MSFRFRFQAAVVIEDRFALGLTEKARLLRFSICPFRQTPLYHSPSSSSKESEHNTESNGRGCGTRDISDESEEDKGKKQQ